MKKYFYLLTILLVSCNSFTNNQQEKLRPNIILIMADDLGFSDLEAYGGEISTPNISFLANNGLKFSTFYNMAKCNPTRSAMLTGLYKGGKGAVHLAQVTKTAGYFNIMSGKEHFDKWVPNYCRAKNAFDKSFTFNGGTEYFLPKSGVFERPYYLNGKKLKPSQIMHTQKPMYQTDFVTDYSLRWLKKSKKEDAPFFLYLSYYAPHYPLQARKGDIAKYRGKYLKGWDKLRKERFERIKALNILPTNTVLSPPEDNKNLIRQPITPAYNNYYEWESLNDKQRDSLDLEMAVYAAMIDRMDQNIGRILDELRKDGRLENTLIMFLSDNGACPFYNNNIEDALPGGANSYWSLRTTWANMANTPFRQYKQSGHEGGSHTPFIAFWPGVIEPNTITSQVGHVVDILPTFMDVLNIEYPDSVNNYSTISPDGTSLLPVFHGKEKELSDYYISGLSKFRMFRKGDYKIVRMNGGEWSLFNLKEDPTELNNIATEKPAILKGYVKDYRKISKKFQERNKK